MIRTLPPQAHRLVEKDGFRIRRIHPGAGFGDPGDGGFGLIDDATLEPGHLVPMQKHRDDEIVSYLRAGRLETAMADGRRWLVLDKRTVASSSPSSFCAQPSEGSPAR